MRRRRWERSRRGAALVLSNAAARRSAPQGSSTPSGRLLAALTRAAPSGGVRLRRPRAGFDGREKRPTAGRPPPCRADPRQEGQVGSRGEGSDRSCRFGRYRDWPLLMPLLPTHCFPFLAIGVCLRIGASGQGRQQAPRSGRRALRRRPDPEKMEPGERASTLAPPRSDLDPLLIPARLLAKALTEVAKRTNLLFRFSEKEGRAYKKGRPT